MENINRIEQTYRRLMAAGRPIHKLYSGNPTEAGFHFPPQILEEVYFKYFQTQEYQPHPKGLLKARQAIQQYYKAGEVQVDPENIILTSSSSESFLYLFSLLAQPGDNILTPNPAYPLFNPIAEMVKVELRHYALSEEKNWEIDLTDLQNKTDARTKAIILVSPNNPTGAVHTIEEISKVVAWANQNNIALICDEVFSEFYFGEGKFPRPAAITKPQLCFTLNGISKMFALPALKLSWIVVTGEVGKIVPVVDSLETMADTFLTCHTPVQEVLPWLFFQAPAFLRDYREAVRRRKDLALKILKSCSDISVIEPRGGFYLIGKVQKDLGLSEDEFVIRLMEAKGIFVHPGYFYDNENGIHFVISFLTKEEKLLEGIKALVSFIEEQS